MNWFSSWILRRTRVVALIGSLLALLGGYYSIELYKNLKTDIHELLPTSARSVVDLKEVNQRLRSIESLAVLIFSSKTEASKKFVIDLATLLEKEPKDVIAGVEYRIDRELAFFQSRQGLYIDLKDLTEIKNYIRDRIQYETELYNPLTIFSEEEIPEPFLDLVALKTKYDTSGFSHLPKGFYATPDEQRRLLLVKLPGSASGIQGSTRLKETVKSAIEKLNPKSYASDLEVKYSGDVENLLEEQEALVEDLEISTVAVTLIVTVGMLLFYRSFRATFALMASLIVGTLWTFGVSYFTVGYLNANSAFLGSIIIGNGINFGIIYLARYLEERRKGRCSLRATKIAMRFTATSTWTAALAAGLSYGSLMLTGFRGFRQFGIIGLIGMILCWISAFTVLPAYLNLFERKRSLISRVKSQPKPYLTEGIVQLIVRFPRWISAISLFISLVSLATFVKLDPSLLETDLTRMRNRDSVEFGAAYLNRYVDEILKRDLGPIAVLANSRENAQKIAEKVRERIEKDPSTLFDRVQTLDDFIPKDQDQKIRVLKEIRTLLNPRILKYMAPEHRAGVGHLLDPAALSGVTEADLPPLVLEIFKEKDQSLGKLVVVDPKRANSELADGKNLIRFITELREIADSVQPGVPVAGSNAVVADMVLAISSDGPKATFFAFLAVILLVIVLFRNLRTIGLVLFALILGVLWLGGIILGFQIKINFLNFIALPITFGIGVDYGVNIFQRFRESPDADILDVIRSAGSAVGLCSFSTIVGYMSLLIARNQGFVSFGALAVAGEITCIIAAILSLPAWIYLRSQHRAKKTLSSDPMQIIDPAMGVISADAQTN